MAISFYGQKWVPATDNATTPLGSATPHAITPPASMTAGQVVLVFVTARNNTAPAVSETGGQTWTSHTQNTNGTTIIGRLFSCVFNGTWSANPSFSTGSTTDGVCLWMGVYDGVDSSIFDVSPTALDLTSSTAHTLPGFNTGVDNAWAHFIWGEPDDNVLSGQDTGWTGPDGSTGALHDHVGNQGGNDIGLFISKKTQATAGATGDNVVATNTADLGAGYYFSLKPYVNVAPTVTLNSPADSGSTSDTTPVLDFTGTDNESNDIRYQVQVDTVDTFDSQTSPTNSGITSEPTTYADSAANTSAMTKITVSASCTVSKIVKRSRGSSGSVNAKALIYQDNAGSPGALVAVGQAVSISTTLGWWDLTFSSPVSLSAGTYWIGAVMDGALRNYYDEITGNYVDSQSGFSYSSPPDPFGTVGGNGVGGYCQYAVCDVPTNPLINAVSGTDSGFANPDNGSDTDPFTSGENIQYTVQSALSAGTYYWRVRGIDTTGGNAFGAWSATRSFTITSGSSGDFVIQDESSASSIDNITLEVGGGTFTMADESSASSIDNIDLQFQGNFEIANEDSLSNIDNITLERNGGDFVIANEDSASSIENIALIGNLKIDDETSASTIDNITLEVGGGSFVVENEASPSSIDSITLEQNGGTLAVGDITSTPEIDNIALIGNFIIGDVVCETTTEEITLEFEGATFEIVDISSTSTVENIPLIGELIIQNSNAPPTIENITLEIAKGDFVIGDLDSSSAITNIRIVKNIPDELKTIFIVNRGKVAKWISGKNYIEL